MSCSWSICDPALHTQAPSSFICKVKPRATSGRKDIHPHLLKTSFFISLNLKISNHFNCSRIPYMHTTHFNQILLSPSSPLPLTTLPSQVDVLSPLNPLSAACLCLGMDVHRAIYESWITSQGSLPLENGLSHLQKLSTWTSSSAGDSEILASIDTVQVLGRKSWVQWVYVCNSALELESWKKSFFWYMDHRGFLWACTWTVYPGNSKQRLNPAGHHWVTCHVR